MASSSVKQVPQALALLEQAIDRDPNYGPALGEAAVCCYLLWIQGSSTDRETDSRKSVEYARRALQVGGDDPRVLATAAMALSYFGADLGAMMAMADRALSLNPSFARCWLISGQIRLWAGQLTAAVEHTETGLRLSPRGDIGAGLAVIELALFLGRRFEAAIRKSLLAIERGPNNPVHYRVLAASYAHLGRLDEARTTFARLRAITPHVMPKVSHFRDPEHRELYLSGLRLAAGEEA
jgi:tetratricopeptide (TPR) repeat protein